MENYTQQYTIVASDMDITYHITPNAILLYFQDCFARFLTSRYLAAFDVIKQDLLWMISEFELEFVNARPLWSDHIEVEIEFTKISSLKIFVRYTIRNDEHVVFAKGNSCWVVINAKTKRPFAAQEMLHEAGIMGNDEKYQAISYKNTSEKALYQTIDHQVNVSDLDFNGHVCNRSYLAIATASAPLDFVRTHSTKYMHIKFVREAFFGETLHCNIYQAENNVNQFWHQIFNSQEKEICSIYTEWEDDEENLGKDVSELIKR